MNQGEKPEIKPVSGFSIIDILDKPKTQFSKESTDLFNTCILKQAEVDEKEFSIPVSWDSNGINHSLFNFLKNQSNPKEEDSEKVYPNSENRTIFETLSKLSLVHPLFRQILIAAFPEKKDLLLSNNISNLIEILNQFPNNTEAQNLLQIANINSSNKGIPLENLSNLENFGICTNGFDQLTGFPSSITSTQFSSPFSGLPFPLSSLIQLREKFFCMSNFDNIQDYS